jgi:hypothetical protein
MECPECFATIPDMAKFCPECGKKLNISSSTAKIEDSVVTRSPGAGSNYAPVINVSSSTTAKDEKILHCPNCDMEISQYNKPLKCMECGAKFCENCEGFYRHEVRQRGEKPLCYKCYTAIGVKPDNNSVEPLSKVSSEPSGKGISQPSSKESAEPIIKSQPADIPATIPANKVNVTNQIFCPNCSTANMSDSMFCISCGKPISPRSIPVSPPTPAPFSQPIQASSSKTSAAWWLLPLVFNWLGGVIAWMVVREKDKAKAKRLLIFGIVMVFVWIAIYVVAYAASMQ